MPANELKSLLPEEIRLDGKTQPRVAIDEAVVEEYAEAIKGGATLPPIVVFFDGASHWLADGFHRYHGHKRAKSFAIPAEIRSGTCRDAVLYSCGANAEHGLRRTNADKRRAVEMLLADAEWREWSDVRISESAAVSHTFVAKIRGEVATVATSPPPTTSVGKDGKRYPRPAPKPAPKSTAHSEQLNDEAPRNAAAPEPPALDSEGQPIPKRLEGVFANAAEYTSLQRQLGALRNAAEELADGKSGAFVDKASLVLYLKDAGHLLAFAKPHAVCPRCNGSGAESCHPCRGSGFVNKTAWKECKK